MLLFLFRLLFRCHWFYSPFHSSWKICNGLLLQLVECIESLKSEVKKKMMMQERMIVVPKSLNENFASKIFCEELRRSFNSLSFPSAITLQRRISRRRDAQFLTDQIAFDPVSAPCISCDARL